MLKTPVIHPEILSALAMCGHKAKILIADSNYSFVTNSSPEAKIIYLNFTPGMIPSKNILEGVNQLINVESAAMMAWPQEFDNTAHVDYGKLLPKDTEIELMNREDFYAAVKAKDTLVVIASGETRRFANLLLTVGPVFD